MLYAPSTIAISSVLIVLSDRRIDCGEWLRLIPDSVLPVAANALLEHHASALDVDGCMDDMRRSLQRESRLSSPTSVQEMEEFRPIPEALKDSEDNADEPASKKVKTCL